MSAGLIECICADVKANAGNPKGILVTALFRTGHALRFGPWILRPLAWIYGVFYRVAVEWVMGIELPWKTVAGPGLRIDHGVGLVVHDHTILGAGCTLRNGVTLGIRDLKQKGCPAAPVLGDRVDVGVHAVIIGPVNVGDDAVIGAGSVVLKDVPRGAVVVGNPARIIRQA